MDTQQPDTKVYCKKCKHCYDIDIIMDPKVNVAIVFVYFDCLLIFLALNYIADRSFRHIAGENRTICNKTRRL